MKNAWPHASTKFHGQINYVEGELKKEKCPWGGRYLKYRPPPGTSILAQEEEWSRRKLGSRRRRKKRAYTAGTLCARDGGRAGEAVGLAGISRRRDRSRARQRRGRPGCRLSPQTACSRDGTRRSGIGRPVQTSWCVQRPVMFGNRKLERGGVAVA